MATQTTTKKTTDVRASNGMSAKLRFHRQQPRKTRLVANLVRGKNVARAIDELTHLNKKASGGIKQLLESAAANAKQQHGYEKDELVVREIRVDKGITFKRFMPRARGRAAPIRKRTSHISVVLGTTDQHKESGVENKGHEAHQKTANSTSPTS